MPQASHRFRAPAPPRQISPFDGILPVDKPAGPTSHDIVDKVRKHFGIKKVGHGGTLDPGATGLLILLLGKGTKLSNRFLTGDKTYEGTLCLGRETDSQDADGETVAEADPSGVTREQVEAETRKLIGDIYQLPPMVSAIKINGVPLYKRARKGEVVERPPRLIHVYEFRLLEWNLPEVRFMVRCSKGTYVRTLCHDIGQGLGCGGHLAKLRRTECGKLTLNEAIGLDALLELTGDQLKERILPLHQFAGLPGGKA